MTTEHDSNPNQFEAILAPNSRPAGERFNTSTENYCAGFPELKPPHWLVNEAAKFAAQRAITLVSTTGNQQV